MTNDSAIKLMRKGRLGVMRDVVRNSLLLAWLVATVACSTDNLVGKNDLPSNVVDPARAKTAEGARGAYIAAIVTFRETVGGGLNSYVIETANLTDEAFATTNGDITGISDGRLLPEARFTRQDSLYRSLQRVRAQANQARGLLRDYYPAARQGPLIAHMYAIEGYAELLLAEAFCSGVPLSTLDYNGDYTLRPGSSTADVLDHALAQFDSALALSGDSVRILNVARVGKARTLQQLGRLNDASQAVADVPSTFVYALNYSVSAKVCGLWDCVALMVTQAPGPKDREGGTGLPFVSESDARIPAFITSTSWVGIRADIPQDHRITLASGTEVELIRAEADLAAGNANWLTRLNALRTTCTDAAMCPTPEPAGTGGVVGLPLLLDPGSDAARLDLLMRERAYWLYLTGHRQGDLRRLIREYGRIDDETYPTGSYNVDYFYGSDVTFPIPQTERQLNSQFKGCINRDA